MKQLLWILVLGLLLSGNVFSAENLTTKELNRSIINNDWLKNKRVSDLRLLGFKYANPRITTTGDNVQYHLVRLLPDGRFVYVICFVDVKKTICKLP